MYKQELISIFGTVLSPGVEEGNSSGQNQVFPSRPTELQLEFVQQLAFSGSTKGI